MRLDHAGHQEGAGAVDHLGADDRRRAHAVAALDDARDAVALHQHVAGERRLAAAVEDAHVGEEDVGHRGVPSALRREEIAQLARHSSGRSIGVQWPQRGSTTTRLLFARCSLSAMARTDCGGATPSSSPVTSSTGASIRSTAAACASASASQLRA